MDSTPAFCYSKVWYESKWENSEDLARSRLKGQP